MSNENIDFLEMLAALAVEDMKKSGVLASVTIAQGILESGWGKSELAVNACNFFGMKASLSGNTWPGSAWDGATYTKETGEQKPDGTRYTVTADFRRYKSMAESVADHSAYLTGAKKGDDLRYKGLAGQRDARTALQIIKDGGYATSVDYVANVMRVVDTYNLTKYDGQEGDSMKTVKIMLDAGHYGKYNRSPGVQAYYESDFTFKFVDMLAAELGRYGIVTGKTRTEQAKDMALQSRGKAAAGYDLFISIHSNAVGSGVNNSVDYPVAITMVNDDKTDIDEISKDIGEKLTDTVASVMQTNQAGRTYTKLSASDRDGNGIMDDEYYGVLHGAKLVKVPGIILEHSFHTCNRAATWLLDNANLQRMAAAEAATLAAYYGMTEGQQAAEPTKQPEAPQTTPDVWYRVRKTWADKASQLGAYRVKDNAVKNCPEGYSVFDNDGKAVYTNKPTDKTPDTLYRVRKAWADAAGQLGAYKFYDNAVNNCPVGYSVFDGAGKVVYSNISQREYTVKKGDTLGKIAKTYGTTVDAIVAANKARYPKITANYIVTGWKLVIQ